MQFTLALYCDGVTKSYYFSIVLRLSNFYKCKKLTSVNFSVSPEYIVLNKYEDYVKKIWRLCEDLVMGKLNLIGAV